MNISNEALHQAVTNQLLGFRPQNATPTNDFNVIPEYALIAHLPDDVTIRIHEFSIELQSRFPDHYYYSPEQYHLTVVPVPHNLEPGRVVTSIEPILKGCHLPITAYGYTVSPFAAGPVLYPEESSLLPMRTKLREALGIPDQAYTRHGTVWEHLLWVNFLRFTAKPEDDMLALLRSHAEEAIGRFTLTNYELYETSTKTLDPATSKLLYTFEV